MRVHKSILFRVGSSLGRELFLLLVPLLAASSCQFAVNVVWVAEDSGTSKTAMQEARYGHGIALVNGKVYAIGGQTGHQISDIYIRHKRRI